MCSLSCRKFLWSIIFASLELWVRVVISLIIMWKVPHHAWQSLSGSRVMTCDIYYRIWVTFPPLQLMFITTRRMLFKLLIMTYIGRKLNILQSNNYFSCHQLLQSYFIASLYAFLSVNLTSNTFFLKKKKKKKKTNTYTYYI